MRMKWNRALNPQGYSIPTLRGDNFIIYLPRQTGNSLGPGMGYKKVMVIPQVGSVFVKLW